jgi:hypothetical protein
MFIGIGISLAARGAAGAGFPSIQLSSASIAEDAAGDAVIGTLSVANGSGSYTFSITADPDSKFQIINDDELALGTEATLDYETATSHLVTIEADNGVDDPISRQFTITVTNVIEAPVNVTPPAVTGSVEVGSTLSCSTGTWTDMGAGSFAYQWKDAADDSNLDGETANTLALTHDLLDIEVYCTVTATNAADSTAADSNTVGPVVDTTAPILSSASASGTGLTTASAGVSTNEGNGTLYVVVTESATQPTAAQIKAGDDHADADAAFADNAAVSATGAQTPFSVTGLTHTTDYWAHFMHEDAEGNQSAVVTASFETDAATVPDAFEAGDWSIAAGDEEADVTISSLPDDGGDTITDVEYRLDGGSWVSSGGTTSFTISGLTNDQEYDVELRAVNSVGAGAASDTKQVTPEAAGGDFVSDVQALLGAKLRAFWLYDDPAHLWQDTSGTTPVAGDTDPVGRVDDLSGNGKHLLQSTSGNRPAYRTGPARTVYDGVNDQLAVTTPAFPMDELELFQVVEQHATATGSQGLYSFCPTSGSDWNSTSGLTVNLSDGSTIIRFEANSGNLACVQSGSGNLPLALYETRKTTTTAELLINGTSIATDSSFTALSSTHAGDFLDGARLNSGSVSLFGPIARRCTIMTAALTTQERSDLRGLINGRYALW